MKKIFNIEPYLGIETEFDFLNFINNRSKKINYYQSKLETLIKNFVATDKEICVLNSGTSAIHLALVLSGVDEGDTVFCSSSSFIASVNPIIYLKAKPYFVDVDVSTGNLNPEYLEKAIIKSLETKQNPKAIIVTHSYGIPANLDKIIVLAKKYDLKLIEDAAEALGSYINNTHCGVIGDYGIFSFNSNKIATSLGGGALVVNDANEKKNIQSLSTQSKDNPLNFIHSCLGYNYKLNDIVAYLGFLQFKNLNFELEKKQLISKWYCKEFKKSIINNSSFFINENNTSNNWMNYLLLDDEILKSRVQNYCINERIEVRDYWFPLHLQSYLNHYNYEGNGESVVLNKRILCLPSSINLEKEDIATIVKVVKKGIGAC